MSHANPSSASDSSASPAAPTVSLAPGLSRRGFVQGAGLAAAAIGFPTIVPSSALGDTTAVAASNRIGMGFIGIGKMGRGHLSTFAGRRDVQVLAVCDVDKTRREDSKRLVDEKAKKLERTSACDMTDDFREVLARKDIDAVLIATPDHWHTIPLIEAAKAGKDIYCEKPLTLTIRESQLVVQAVRKHQRIMQTGSQQRSEDKFRWACELVRAGRIGKIKEVEVNVGGPSKFCDLKEEPMEPGLNWDRWLGTAPLRPYNAVLSPRGLCDHFPNWRSYREYSGGGMTDWGAHHFDIAQWGIGMDKSGPDEIIPPANPAKGTGVRFIYHKTPVGDNVTMIHGGGGGVTFRGETGTIVCNRGKLESNPPEIAAEILKLANDKKLVDGHIPNATTPLYVSRSHHDNWIDGIRTRKDPICDIEIGAGSAAICHLGNLAYWHGKAMKWDPKNWKFLDDTDPKLLDRERRDPWQLPSV